MMDYSDCCAVSASGMLSDLKRSLKKLVISFGLSVPVVLESYLVKICYM